MMTELLITVFATIVIFSAGLAAGYRMHWAAHKDGVKLMDRMRHDQEPFSDGFEEKEIQTTTGGEFEEV